MHPEAVWFTKVFSGRSCSTRQEAVAILLEHGENDARALCFAALLFFREPLDQDHGWRYLRRSAQLGYPFAQAELARRLRSEEKFTLAQKSALQGERDGLFLLSKLYQIGFGCKRDLELAKGNALVAAQLGHVDAMYMLGELLDEADPERWTWWGKAAKQGVHFQVMNHVYQYISRVMAGKYRPSIVFAIGRVLKGNVNAEKREVFGESHNFNYWVYPSYRAIDFFIAQSFAARQAVDTWTRVGIRLKIVKDIRIIIGKMIWEARSDAEYRT